MNRRNLFKFLPAAILSAGWDMATALGAGSWVKVSSATLTDESRDAHTLASTKSQSLKYKTFDAWIVGEWIDDDSEGGGNSWAVVGIYGSEAKAIKACENDRCFVGPMFLDETREDEGGFDHDSGYWAGLWYPTWEENPRLAPPSSFVIPVHWIKGINGNYDTFFSKGYPGSGGEYLLSQLESAEFVELERRRIVILPKGQVLIEEYESSLTKVNQGSRPGSPK